MELKLPPPLIFILCAITIYCLPSPCPTLLLLQLLAALLILAGLYLDLASLWAFWQQKTTINPLKPNNTRTLATTGVYRFSRNPMYLSLACYLLAISLWQANPFGILFIWGFVAYITHFQILPEERILQAKFGQAYLDYQARVRRWL